MLSFKHTLSDTEMWQVSLLLKKATAEVPALIARIPNPSKP
jgi:hypothetical protein